MNRSFSTVQFSRFLPCVWHGKHLSHWHHDGNWYWCKNHPWHNLRAKNTWIRGSMVWLLAVWFCRCALVYQELVSCHCKWIYNTYASSYRNMNPRIHPIPENSFSLCNTLALHRYSIYAAIIPKLCFNTKIQPTKLKTNDAVAARIRMNKKKHLIVNKIGAKYYHVINLAINLLYFAMDLPSFFMQNIHC